ncbi:hypothetical protein BKA82DRAFT_723660 [Pisolithus tinctorius]|uniref:Uncharacterized protein n=1 Tax=Pisolithus tinctorius Marx 270 TaxID=870435 RepID=A0A0C3IXZ5_PISTI|nr:hypothetical protein BKA82DRAFT_723660 [Pisolithus tinctorius]KIO01698.1 hypothetical protein M404DRAFT_723660 [Pisolithus tinctorius Marx 270]
MWRSLHVCHIPTFSLLSPVLFCYSLLGGRTTVLYHLFVISTIMVMVHVSVVLTPTGPFDFPQSLFLCSYVLFFAGAAIITIQYLG